MCSAYVPGFSASPRSHVTDAAHGSDLRCAGAAPGLPRDGRADEAGAAEDHEPLRGVRGGHDE